MRAIVLILRGCPAGWLGAYGNEWVVTPNLDRLASESVVFDRHISDRPSSEGANRAWLGDPPGYLHDLQSAGVRTMLVRANHPDTDASEWFYAPWGEVFDARPQEEDESPLDALLRGLPSLLERLGQSPEFLLWVEIDRLLPPWDVSPAVFKAYLEHEGDSDETPEGDDEDPSSDGPSNEPEDPARVAEEIEPWRDPPTGPFDSSDPDARNWLATTFGAVLTELDTELGKLFDLLRAAELDRSAAWIVTSDFGYPLGEHGQIGVHRPWLYEELVHLPLILRLPGAEEAGRRVPALTQPSDLPLTLGALYGRKPNEGSLLPLARGQTASLHEAAISSLDLGGAAERSIRTAEWAYLLPIRVPEGESREAQLYQKPDDRWEVNDVRNRNLELADVLAARLQEN